MTKRDWQRIAIAFAVITILWTVGGFVIAHNYANIHDNQRRLEELGQNVTASLCLQAYAPETHEPGIDDEKELVEKYVNRVDIPMTNPVCRRAVDTARAQIAGTFEEP